MKLIVQSLVVLSLVITGCAETGPKASSAEFSSNYFYARCIQKETKKGDENAEEYCACVLRENPTLSLKKVAATSRTCNQLSSIRSIKVEPFKPVCPTFEENQSAKIGDIVQIYRTYIQKEWVDGVRPQYNGLVWKVIDKNNNGVFFQLIQGSTKYTKEGETKRMGDTEYQYYNPGSDLGDGIMKSLKVCKDYK